MTQQAISWFQGTDTRHHSLSRLSSKRGRIRHIHPRKGSRISVNKEVLAPKYGQTHKKTGMATTREPSTPNLPSQLCSTQGQWASIPKHKICLTYSKTALAYNSKATALRLAKSSRVRAKLAPRPRTSNPTGRPPPTPPKRSSRPTSPWRKGSSRPWRAGRPPPAWGRGSWTRKGNNCTTGRP
jgi:hypothetical protein